jgi:cellulose synthase/poly-beta-1,6-N-acetylglucosamine synthase-like glycosyltransferase
MRVCYLLQTPAHAELIGERWARALSAQRTSLEDLTFGIASANAALTRVRYDVVLADLTDVASLAIASVADLLLMQPLCRLVVLASEPLPRDPETLEGWRACLERADLVLSPSSEICGAIRAQLDVEAFELAAPTALDAASWSGHAVAPVAPGAFRQLTVVRRGGPAPLRLARELGVLATMSLAVSLRRRVRWLEPNAAACERERCLSRSEFVYLPEPIEDAGALAADCARHGAILIAPVDYAPAKQLFPYTAFSRTQARRAGLLLLWLQTSREYREFFRDSARYAAVWLNDENRRVQWLRRLQYSFPRELFAEALPASTLDEPRALLAQIEHRSGPEQDDRAQNACVLVCLVRNGEEHLPAFLRHYRGLGVRHLYFIDNGSDDRTLELLDGHPDVTVYQTALPHKHYERELRRLIIEKHCRGRWCLNVDVDELFDYPRSDRLELTALLAYLASQNATAMAGYMLDMYARENVFGDAGELDLRSAYPCYDIDDITRSDYHAPQVLPFCDQNVLLGGSVDCRFGGVRKTLFGNKTGEDYLLNKHPLIFLDGRLEPVTHPHYSNGARVADVTCVLYHYKFTPRFKAKVEESRMSGRYVKFAQGQYDRYQRQISEHTSLVIDTPGTRRLESVDDLVRRGFLSVSPAFEAHVHAAGEGVTTGRRGAVAGASRAAGGGSTAVAPSAMTEAPHRAELRRCSAVAGPNPVVACAALAALILAAGAARTALVSGGGAPPSWLLGGPVARAFQTPVRWVFSLLGVPALLSLAAAAVYSLAGLWQRRRPLGVLAAVLLLGAACSPIGIWIIAIAAGWVLTTNALTYTFFALRTLLRGRSGGAGTTPASAQKARIAHGASPATGASPTAQSVPRVCIVVPARDEEAVIEQTLRALSRVDHPRGQLEICLIDDGSTDGTRARAEGLAAELLHPLRVLSHAASAGKARRLNQLLPTLDAEYVLLLDADHTVEPDILRRMLARFEGGEDIACVQAASAVRNGAASWLARALELEYLFRCQGIYPGKSIGIFVGSGGLFRRSELLAAGGFDPEMLTEDVELSYRLYARQRRIVYEPGACTHELATTDFVNFFNQRHRWMRGLWQAMLHHAELAGASRGEGLRRAWPEFLQFTADGLGTLCLCVLAALMLLEQLGLLLSPAWLPIDVTMIGCSFAFAVGFVRARRASRLWLLPIVPVYMILHAVPTLWALIDSYVLGKPVVWVKTERGVESGGARSRTVRWMGGRA